MTALYQLVAQYRELQQIDAEDIDEQTLKDTLEGLEGELTVKATNVAMLALNLATFAENIEDAAKRMKDRAARVKRRSDQVQSYLKTMMDAAQITKIEAPEFTLSIKKNPHSLMIAPGVTIPDEFMVKPEAPPPHPDNAALKTALKAGRVIDGCRLDQGTRLEIKA